MIRQKHVVRLVLGISLLTALGNSATAELLVAGASGLDAISVGARFSDDYVFDLPPNSELRLLRSPSNTLFVMHGPYKGTLSTFIESCTGILATIRRYCRNDSAGDQLPVGGTRGRPDR
jgi:hypothetical protein